MTMYDTYYTSVLAFQPPQLPCTRKGNMLDLPKYTVLKAVSFFADVQ